MQPRQNSVLSLTLGIVHVYISTDRLRSLCARPAANPTSRPAMKLLDQLRQVLRSWETGTSYVSPGRSVRRTGSAQFQPASAAGRLAAGSPPAPGGSPRRPASPSRRAPGREPLSPWHAHLRQTPMPVVSTTHVAAPPKATFAVFSDIDHAVGRFSAIQRLEKLTPPDPLASALDSRRPASCSARKPPRR